MPPLSITRCSRAVHAASASAEGATAETPMNGAPGMRTPGISADVAHPSCISQCTRNGSVMTSRRKPSPGMIALKPVGCAMMSVNSISRRSPGIAPLMNTGPVKGCTAPKSIVAKSATVEAGPSLAIHAIARFECDLLAFADLDYGRNVRVVPVVATVRFVAELLASIDMDRVHQVVPPAGSGKGTPAPVAGGVAVPRRMINGYPMKVKCHEFRLDPGHYRSA